jgi:rhodanese-related sulfurtransferase
MNKRAFRLVILAVLFAAPLTAQVADEGAVPRISPADLKKAADAGQALIVDVRDPRSYADGHIPGSINVPLDALPQKAAVLKGAKKTIVTYCS